MLYNNITKRYALVFQLWYYEYTDFECRYKQPIIKSSIEQFDTYDEMMKIANLYNELYKDTPIPELVESFYYDKKTKEKINVRKNGLYVVYPKENTYGIVEKHYDYDNGNAKHWGYVLIDYKEEKILNVVHDKFSPFDVGQWKYDLALKDSLFRKKGEVPDNYIWDDGEYEGWLQFRFGNGMNAIEIEDKLNLNNKNKNKNI